MMFNVLNRFIFKIVTKMKEGSKIKQNSMAGLSSSNKVKKKKQAAPPADNDADIKNKDANGFSGTGKNIDLSTLKKKK
jgi:hypothetical protein